MDTINADIAEETICDIQDGIDRLQNDIDGLIEGIVDVRNNNKILTGKHLDYQSLLEYLDYASKHLADARDELESSLFYTSILEN